MHIQHVEIGNFRKLQGVRIDFAAETTVFVGANNSGKTSAMVALRRFLVDRTDFSVNDFTLSHWGLLNVAAAAWETGSAANADEAFDWGTVLPHLDVWLNVSADDLHYVQKILPTLDWAGANVGVRLRYEPTDFQKLKEEYLLARHAAASVMCAATLQPTEMTDAFALWPKSMMDFLARRLRSVFEVRAYLLDPAKLVPPKDGLAAPQPLPAGSEPIEGDPFKGLIRIDEISAQRGFGLGSVALSEADSEGDISSTPAGKRLSSQLRSYYKQHLDPFDQPESKDIDALQALHEAQTAFGRRLSICFAAALKELEEIGYPGITDPKLTISSSIKPIDGLNHASAVQYEVPTHVSADGIGYRLPEESNGLGYQNLVSMVFALMSFRDKRMKVGKAAKSAKVADAIIQPLHLVLIEEPEAHLHAQVQQVFINQAYDVLRNHTELKTSKDLRTQMVVSTHSSHLAHEADFASLRYFRRLPVKPIAGAVPVSSVVNLSELFGTQNQTERFVKRYLKATHCDLFFADGAVLVEGPAERILVPHFVSKRERYAHLRSCYITWLEIGGSHAHTLKSLLVHLGLNTLIITDIDAKNAENKTVPPMRNLGLSTRNETLKTWIPAKESLDALLDNKPEEMISADASGYAIRVAYQQPISVKFKTADSKEALANTFEDALVYENIDLFQSLLGGGLIGRFRDALTNSSDLATLGVVVTDALAKGGKAEFAMELLYRDEIDTLKIPAYISDGLNWLSEQLKRKEDDLDGSSTAPPIAAAPLAFDPANSGTAQAVA
jgi:predicted ATP-dependent endonuclease of OLD family